MPAKPAYITVRTAATILNLSPQQVYLMLRLGQLTPVAAHPDYEDGQIYVARAEVEREARAREKGAKRDGNV